VALLVGDSGVFVGCSRGVDKRFFGEAATAAVTGVVAVWDAEAAAALPLGRFVRDSDAPDPKSLVDIVAIERSPPRLVALDSLLGAAAREGEVLLGGGLLWPV
jgi:hypothetical protein